MNRSRARLALSLLSLAGIALASSRVDAAGLYYSERGVRPLARAGAFVAGADDLGAIAYNPAGLADTSTAILADFSWVNVTSDFTRKTVVTDAAGNESVATSPTVHGTTPFIPIPTIAGSFALPNNLLTFALGVYTPYAALLQYPKTVDGQPAASRYSLVSLEGSVLAIIGAYVAFKPIEQVRIGAGFEALTGTLQNSLFFNASPKDRLLSAPESPQYDAEATLKTKTIFAPAGHFGVTLVPHKSVRIGGAFRTAFDVDVPADLNVVLPKAVTFDNAKQEGSGVHVRTTLPAVIRAGVEYRVPDVARIELAYVRELWNVHREIAIDSEDLAFTGITGFPSPFKVPNVSIPRQFKPSNSFRLGGEVTVAKDPGIDLRGGVAYETSAIPEDYLTPLTADLRRVTLGLGAGIRPHPQWRLDVMYAHVFAIEADVDPKTAAVPAVNPVQGNPTSVESINGGTYSNAGNIVGLGATVKF
jgi:long-chain fatty acid transport protein